MTSHKPRDAKDGDEDRIAKEEAMLIETGPQDVRVLRAKLANIEELSIMDDDFGSDPYNSTGQFVALPDKDDDR